MILTTTPVPTPVFVNIVTYDDMAIILILGCLLGLLTVGTMLFILFNTLIRKGGGVKTP